MTRQDPEGPCRARGAPCHGMAHPCTHHVPACSVRQDLATPSLLARDGGPRALLGPDSPLSEPVLARFSLKKRSKTVKNSCFCPWGSPPRPPHQPAKGRFCTFVRKRKNNHFWKKWTKGTLPLPGSPSCFSLGKALRMARKVRFQGEADSPSPG